MGEADVVPRDPITLDLTFWYVCVSHWLIRRPIHCPIELGAHGRVMPNHVLHSCPIVCLDFFWRKILKENIL